MKNKLFIIPGYLVGIGSLFIITYRTILAFLSGSQSITLYINRYGEQYADIFFLAIIWIICLLGLLYLYKTIKEDKKTNSLGYDMMGKRVVNKQGINIGMLHNSLVDEKTGLVSKIHIKPANGIDSSFYQINDKGNIVVSFNNVDIRKNDIIIK